MTPFIDPDDPRPSTTPARHRPTRLLAAVATAFALVACSGPPADSAPSPSPQARAGVSDRPGVSVSAAVDAAAVPVADGAALAAALDGAGIIGLGEASHSAHEAFALKRDVLEHLVDSRRSATFALEVSWSTGLLLDDYVVHGKGRPDAILDREMQGEYRFWNTREYAGLLRWMRRWNVDHPHRRPLRFVGTDLGFAGPAVFDRVRAGVARLAPGRLPELDALVRSLRPTTSTQAGAWMVAQRTADLGERRADAARARALIALVAGVSPRHAPVRRHARAIGQTFEAYAFPERRFADRMAYRDRAMAANTVWWWRHHARPVVLASNNSHVGYVSAEPDLFPETAGEHVRDVVGDAYVSVGMTLGRGRIRAFADPTSSEPRRFVVPEPGPRGNERLLDAVRPDDYLVDLRALPRTARAWFARARPTRSYGLYWTDGPYPPVALGETYDLVVHVHQVSPGRLRPTRE